MEAANNTGGGAVNIIEAKQYWTSPNGSRDDTTQIVVHHAAYVYPPGKAVEMIYDYHRSKWPTYNACGYHEVIQEEVGGALACYLVNPPDLIGAGVWGLNGHTFHICAATNFTGVPGSAWLDALADRLAEAKRRYPKAQIVGHGDIALPGHGTTCPGAQWKAWRATLLDRVAQRAQVDVVALWGPRPVNWAFAIPRAWVPRARELGAATTDEYYPIAGQPLSIQTFERGVGVFRDGTARVFTFEELKLTT
jgi:N-acetylmuramoyl-L-alanine amidase